MKPLPSSRRQNSSRSLLLVRFLLLPVAVFACGPLAGQQSQGSPEQLWQLARELVQQLGHEHFSHRESATQQLIELGAAAIPWLEVAAESKDREVRYRGRLVLEIVRQADFQRRLEQFARSEDPSDDQGLVGWQYYRTHIGETPADRALFAAMYRAEPDLMQLSGSAPAAGRALQARLIQLRQSAQVLDVRQPMESTAAILFVLTDPNVPLTEAVNSDVRFVSQRQQFLAALKDGPYQKSLRKMLALWLLRDDCQPVQDSLYLSMLLDVDGVLPRAREVAANRQRQPQERQFALLCLAKFGGKPELPLLEELLADRTLCAQIPYRGRMFVIKLSDLALAGLLHLEDLRFADFGYPHLQRQAPFVFAGAGLGFPSEREREAAIEAWKQWRAGERG